MIRVAALILVTTFAVGACTDISPDEAPRRESVVTAPVGQAAWCDGVTDLLREGEELIAAYAIDDGAIGESCTGAHDDDLLDAWTILSSIAPPEQLAPLVVLAGYREVDPGDEVTVAFVDVLDGDGTAFQLTINLDEATYDDGEFRLTLAHELTHVITATPDQLDRGIDSFTCPTYFNGDGCYVTDGLLADWIDAFWSDRIDDVDPYLEPETVDGEELCAADPSFLGPYAATNPEEDFAEAFSAFVFRVPLDTDALDEKLAFFEERPELVAFRDRADEAGLTPVTYAFERCG